MGNQLNTKHIDKNMIERGIRQGVIRFVADPNFEEGTVCAIGNNWFYFGGAIAEDAKPEEYLKEVGLGTAVIEIYEVLQDFAEGEEFVDEYNYYYEYLRENLTAWEDKKEKKMSLEEAVEIIRNTAFLGTDETMQRVTMAIDTLDEYLAKEEKR